MSVEIIKDIDVITEFEQYDALLLGISAYNAFMDGIQRKIKLKYPVLQEIIDNTPYADLNKLGNVVALQTSKPHILLGFMYGWPERRARPFVRYDALEKMLETVNDKYKGKRVCTVMLGATCFDGRGDREKSLEIMKRVCKKVKLFVYDYEHLGVREEARQLEDKIRLKLGLIHSRTPETWRKVEVYSSQLCDKLGIPFDSNYFRSCMYESKGIIYRSYEERFEDYVNFDLSTLKSVDWNGCKPKG